MLHSAYPDWGQSVAERFQKFAVIHSIFDCSIRPGPNSLGRCSSARRRRATGAVYVVGSASGHPRRSLHSPRSRLMRLSTARRPSGRRPCSSCSIHSHPPAMQRFGVSRLCGALWAIICSGTPPFVAQLCARACTLAPARIDTHSSRVGGGGSKPCCDVDADVPADFFCRCACARVRVPPTNGRSTSRSCRGPSSRP